jgi:Ca2+-binding RTX toxin-like protein
MTDTIKLSGTPGSDQIRGGDDNYYVDAGPGTDFILVGTGFNTVYSGSGDDYVLVGAHEVEPYIIGPDGKPISGSSVFPQVSGDSYVDLGAGSDQAFAGAGNDTLLGGSGNDYLFGGNGNDWLDGGPGNDILVGAGGADVLIGGPGADHIYAGGGDSVYADSLDLISIDAQGGGTLSIDGATANTQYDFTDVSGNPIPRDSISFADGQMIETSGSSTLTVFGAFTSDAQFDLAVNNGIVTGVV